MAMISPAYVEKSPAGKLAALKMVPPSAHQLAADHLPEVEQELQSSPLPQLDVLWHYECVVSPRSPAPNLKSSPASPRSPAAIAADLNPTVSSHDHHRSASPPYSPPSRAAAAASSSSAAPSALSRFAPAQQALAKRVFNTFDENGDGRVSTEEIGRMLEKLGLSRAAEEKEEEEEEKSLTASLLADMPSFATKKEGEMDEEEFVLLYEMACFFVQEQDGGSAAAAEDGSSPWELDGEEEEAAEEDLRAAFHVFDKDGNGYISPAELQSVLCSLGFEQAQQLEACEDMIARVDENGDGHVDFFEFKKLFHMDNPFLPAIQTF